MSAVVVKLPFIHLDANGLPHAHKHACFVACQEAADFVAELPESFYHLTATDCGEMVDRIIGRYLQVVKHEHPSQREVKP